MFLQVAIEQSKTLMFEVDRRISDYTSICDLRNRISAGVKKSWILMFVCVSSWKLRCLAKITHKHIIYIYDLWIYTRMKRDMLFTYRKKVTRFEAKKGPKIRCIPQRWGFLLILTKKKTLHFGKLAYGEHLWTSLNMFNFNASKAAGLDILRCQEMMILY